MLLPIAEALSLAHSRGVVHRDLKPDNIFIATEGSVVQPKLLDFGIAKVTSGALSGGPTLTQTGTLLGSPDYMSPEQAYAQPDVDERSDIWAFSVVLYEALAGAPPFQGGSVGAILRSVVQDEPAPLDHVDPSLSLIVRRGLIKDRDARPSSIFELGRQLALWLFAQGISEDVTGASLEAKWLGRSTESVLFTPGALSPRAQHEHATLVSVVHPSPRPNSAPIALPLERSRRWIPVTLAGSVAVAATALLSLGSLKQAPLAAGGTLAAAPAVPVTAAPAPRAEPLPPPVDVTEIPPLPTVVPSPNPPATKPPVRLPLANRIPAAPALPRALPAESSPAPVREKRADLMNPY
jgi:serine/threonine-protein kinase